MLLQGLLHQLYSYHQCYKHIIYNHYLVAVSYTHLCGMCSLYINGHPHGPATGATTCQIYMRRFNDGDTILSLIHIFMEQSTDASGNSE